MALKIEEVPAHDTPSFPFEVEWTESGGTDPFHGLNAIADFNASFDDSFSNASNSPLPSTSPRFLDELTPVANTDNSLHTSSSNSVGEEILPDSQDTFIDHPSRDNIPQMGYQDFREGQGLYMEDAVASPWSDFTGYDASPLTQEAAWSPSVYPSTEAERSAIMHRYPTLQPLRNSYLFQRRSISEPPTGPPTAHLGYPHNPQPAFPPGGGMPPTQWNLPRPMAPQPPQLVRLKRTPKSKRPMTPQPRHYRKHTIQKPRVTRSAAKRARGPTSMPSSPELREHYPNAQIVNEVPIGRPFQSPSPHMSSLQFVSTRVCTPTPSPRREVDAGRSEVLSIPVSVEALQAMITDAVKKAVKESKAEGEDRGE